MARLQSAAAGDALGLEPVERLNEAFNAGQMRAVGASARDKLSVAVEQQRAVALLAERSEPLDAVDALALVTGRKLQDHGRDVRRRQGFAQRSRERLRIRDSGRDQHQPRLGARFGLFRSGSHRSGHVSPIRRDWGEAVPRPNTVTASGSGPCP